MIENIRQEILELASAIRGADIKHETHAILTRVAEMEGRIMKELDDLSAQVEQNNTVLGSAIVLINGIADRIKAAGTDPTKLAQLTADLKAKDDELAAAVAANTPTPPTPPPAPAP